MKARIAPRWLLWLILFAALAAFPPQWYPLAVRQQLAAWFGASSFRTLPESVPGGAGTAEEFCPQDIQGWREGREIAGVRLRPSMTCEADNPYAIAAFVRGTNNVSGEVLMASGLTPDTVVKGADLDGDGDPDEIHIRLEVAELNGGSPETPGPVTRYRMVNVRTSSAAW